eukprot:12788267-Ditylum_brightwellii.AAC.1
MALTSPIGESAAELSTINMMGLECVGVEMEDLYSTANDSCTTTVKAGWLNIGRDLGETMNSRAEVVESGLCYMHLGGFALGLDLFFTKRTTDEVQTNYWAPLCNIYKKIKAILSFLFDRKHKSCSKDYKNAILSMHQEVLSISLPNSTKLTEAHSNATMSLFQSCSDVLCKSKFLICCQGSH